MNRQQFVRYLVKEDVKRPFNVYTGTVILYCVDKNKSFTVNQDLSGKDVDSLIMVGRNTYLVSAIAEVRVAAYAAFVFFVIDITA